jgi:exodeoxyribonuclease VII large subunit
LSFICDTIELAGEGALKKEYDRLLKLLTAQGLFEPTRKRPLPQYLRRIGVITSKQGAVIHDFLNNIGKFGFQIEFIDSRVEGQLAVADLLSSIKTFEKRKIDVLVIIRGGGSLEAMLAFNNEQVVRQIAGFPVPVICGIGHDKDVPLAAMAADIAVSTPTAAANLISESWRKIYQLLDNHQITLLGAYRNALNRIKARLYENTTIIANFKQLLQKIRLLMDKDISQMMADLNLKLAGARQLLDYAQSTINSNNPERQLMLGYSIARIGGKIIKKTAQAGIGEQLDISVSDGMIISKVESLDKKSGR